MSTIAKCTMSWNEAPCPRPPAVVVTVKCSNEHHKLDSKQQELCGRCAAQVWSSPIQCECGSSILLTSRPMPLFMAN